MNPFEETLDLADLVNLDELLTHEIGEENDCNN